MCLSVFHFTSYPPIIHKLPSVSVEAAAWFRLKFMLGILNQLERNKNLMSYKNQPVFNIC